MAHITPFRALRYDPAQVDISRVVTQPYDKITAEMQERYYRANPNNLVRIILGKHESTDRPGGENVYTRAAAYFQDWRRQGIFQQDARPSIYRYAQLFAPPGGTTRMERRGFIALGRLEDYAAGVVFRHEQTLTKPKADRLELLRATRVHFEQLFMLYSDPTGEIDQLLTASSRPDIEVSDEYGVEHQMWRVSDASIIEQVCGHMRDKKLIIADGHHRYETALNYRDERRKPAADGSRELEPFDLAMMTLVNIDSPGLLVLPTHRVVHGLAAFSPDALRARARSHFSVEEVDPSIDASRALTILREAGRSGTALLGVAANRAFLFDRPGTTPSNLLEGLSLRQQSLDVVQLHRGLLQHALGLSEESIRNQQNLSYVRDAGEALARVREGGANLAFLMNPARVQQVQEIALAGEVLPQKSTDFYPKLLSGLTIYAVE